MITIHGARWWRSRAAVNILVAVEDNGLVLLAIGSGNYVELRPSVAAELADNLNRAAAEAQEKLAIAEEGK